MAAIRQIVPIRLVPTYLRHEACVPSLIGKKLIDYEKKITGCLSIYLIVEIPAIIQARDT